MPPFTPIGTSLSILIPRGIYCINNIKGAL